MKTALAQEDKPSINVKFNVDAWIEPGTLTLVQGLIEKALYDATQVHDYGVDLDLTLEG
jgi:hypothetical protein